jgi:hypothetical protein
MSNTRIVGGWVAIFAVITIVLGSIALSANGALPYIGVEQGVFPPYWG